MNSIPRLERYVDIPREQTQRADDILSQHYTDMSAGLKGDAKNAKAAAVAAAGVIASQKQ